MPASVRGRQGCGQGDWRHPHAATLDERDAREGTREERGGQPETKAPPERGWRARTTISKQYPLPRLRLRSLREDAVNSAPGDLVFPHELPDGHVLAVPHDVHAHDGVHLPARVGDLDVLLRPQAGQCPRRRDADHPGDAVVRGHMFDLRKIKTLTAVDLHEFFREIEADGLYQRVERRVHRC